VKYSFLSIKQWSESTVTCSEYIIPFQGCFYP
jgi:hypothetical protein